MTNKDPQSLCKVPVGIILEYSDLVDFDIYLRLSDTKLVKLSNAKELDTDLLEKYKKKGVKSFYAEEEKYKNFMKSFRETMSDDVVKGNKSPEDIVRILDQGFEMARDTFQKLGVSEQSIQMMEEISLNSMVVIKKSKGIFKFFKKFKDNCTETFLQSMLVGNMMVAIIDQFEWSTEAIKQKASLAASLCDVLLSPEDIVLMHDYIKKGKVLPKRIIDHPLTTAEMVKTDPQLVSSEVINIIEQHHERPDGSGFPRGNTATQINILPSIYITAEYFIQLLVEANFDPRKKDDILGNIKLRCKDGNFNKVVMALEKIING